MSLSAEAEKRKERLLALKKRKRGQTDDSVEPSHAIESSDDASSQPESAKVYFPN